MKKLLLTLLMASVMLSSYATHHNPFKRGKDRNATHQKIKKNLPAIGFTKSNALVYVPTIEKYSQWLLDSARWMELYAVGSNYLNNNVDTRYQLSYDLSDTFARATYTYDGSNRLSGVMQSSYDSFTGTFTDIQRQTVTYSTVNNITSTLYYAENYDVMSSSWVPFVRYVTAIDDRGNEVKVLYEMYENNAWVVQGGYSSKITYLGNTRKIVEYVDSGYSQQTMQMEVNFREFRTYNANNQVLDISMFEFDGTALELVQVDSIFYDGQGLPVTLVMHEPDGMSGNLLPFYKLDNLNWGGNFNSVGDIYENQPIGYTGDAFDGSNWVKEGRYSVSFPDNYGSEIDLYEVYDNNNYVFEGRDSYINDDKKNQIEITSETYDVLSSTWTIINSNKEAYQYDMNNNILEDISMYYDAMTSSYVNSSRTEYENYISIVAGVSANKNTIETKVYPNPSADGIVKINVNMEQASAINIQVMDINGKLISKDVKELGKGLNTLGLAELNHGVYFVIITTDFGVSRTKLIVN